LVGAAAIEANPHQRGRTRAKNGKIDTVCLAVGEDRDNLIDGPFDEQVHLLDRREL
jgi:hypothetical protein